MKEAFYSHIIEVNTLIVELDSLNLSDEQNHHLASLIDTSLHHTILDVILSELSDDDKKTFLSHLNSNDHSKIWDHLNSKVENIEDKIKKAADDLKVDLHKDIKEAKEKRVK